jgi:hypothetical protein
MTLRWYVRAVVTVLVGAGAAVGLARAQPPAAAPAQATEPWAVIEFGAGSPPPPHEAAPVAATPAAPRRPILDWLYSKPRPIADSVHDCMHAHGVGCWSHHNSYTCGSWKSECTFIFGSCREFFGEPCLPGPPPPPYVAGGYAPPPGYGPAVPQRSGCPSCQ